MQDMDAAQVGPAQHARPFLMQAHEDGHFGSALVWCTVGFSTQGTGCAACFLRHLHSDKEQNEGEDDGVQEVEVAELEVQEDKLGDMLGLDDIDN